MIKNEIPALTEGEKFRIDPEHGPSVDDGDLTAEQWQMIAERIAEADQDPDGGIPLSQLKAEWAIRS
jgi:L-asparaginase/Glu-tRNA(Gln) amidotransferase subunit D